MIPNMEWDHTNTIAEVGHGGGSTWEEYTELVTDPAHWMLELTIMVIVDVLILALLWPLVIKPVLNKFVAKKLAQRDAEHGH